MLQGNFVTPRRDVLHADHLAMFDNHRVVEVIHRRAHVTRDQVKQVADSGHGARRHFDGQVLLARFQRRQFGAAGDGARRHARIGGNAFVSRVASDHVGFGWLTTVATTSAAGWYPHSAGSCLMLVASL